MNQESNIIVQSSNNGISRIKLNEPSTYNALSLNTLIGLFLLFKFIIFIREDEDTILPFHLLGRKALMGVIASFFEFKDKIGPWTDKL